MRRSVTVPNGLDEEQKKRRAVLPRAKSTADVQQSGHTSAKTQRRPKEGLNEEDQDAFSLGGFFPGIFRWGGKYSEAEAEGEVTAEDSEQAILGEDKLGILRLNREMFRMDEGADDELLVSPYAEGSAVDEESLFLALRQRRAASMGVSGDEPLAVAAGPRRVLSGVPGASDL